MNVKTLLLGHLAKSQQGNAQQQDGDTSVLVPNVFSNVIQVPDLFYFLSSVPQNEPQLHSFIQTDQRVFALNGQIQLCVLAPGLWSVRYAHWITPEGAGTDLTSNVRLQCTLNDGINPTVDLTRCVNSLTYPQALDGEIDLLISSEQTVSFLVQTVVGAGTGTNRSHLRIVASKFL